MSILLVDLNAPGVERLRAEHKMGQRASPVGGLRFSDVRLPAGALLGPEGRGFHMMMSVLDKGRIGIAALALGILQRALEESVSYAKQRVQFGKPIADQQAIRFLIADMAKDAHAARLLVRDAAQGMDAGRRVTLEASIAKCFASDAAVARTADAVQIHGGSGYIRGVTVERLYRDAKITQIYEGTNQIQRVIMAREILS
jgi:alkylation response protein AidB-like acyl-CoA dehydrogenase